jgi:RNA polymerase sigma factor (sigma-70 family)
MTGAKEPIPGRSAALTTHEYEQYAGALKRYLATRVRRPEDVSDLCQEILYHFVRWRSRHTEALRDPLGYLFRIAFRVLEDAAARQKRDPVSLSPQEMERQLDMGGSAGNSPDQAEDLAVQADVIAALKTLPENYLTALMLVEGEGLSYREAAAKTGWQYSTIATYVTQGRAALKFALEGRRPPRGRRT